MTSLRSQLGFTLVELIIVLAIGGVIASVIAPMVIRPLDAYASVNQRTQLVDSAGLTLTRISREVRSALPNSIRVSADGRTVEFLQTIDGGRYRANMASGGGDILDFNPANNDRGFDVLGQLTNSGLITTGAQANDCIAGRADCLVIYNTGLLGHNAYAGNNIATISQVTASRVEFVGDAFPTPSPYQRFHIVTTPITFICDTANRTLRRYANYAIRADHTDVDSHAELVALNADTALLTNNIEDCEFSYDAGNASRNALLTMNLAMSRARSGVANPAGNARVTLLQQAHISNVP